MARKNPVVYVVGSKNRLLWSTFGFVLGAVSAPIVTPMLRPLLRRAMKGGILASREFKKMLDSAREDLEDMAAEAAGELNKKEKP